MSKFIVVCNGPSLKEIDFNHFEGNTILTSNRAYLSFNDFPDGIHHIHIVVNKLVAEQFSDDLEALNCDVYTLKRYRSFFKDDTRVKFLDELPGAGFSDNMDDGVFVGATVTYPMIQIAASMGAKDINIVGLDHSFPVSDQPHKTLDGLKKDVNHYLPNYFPKGIAWQAPDLLESELNYALASLFLAKKGVTIRNYSKASELSIFPKYKYSSKDGFTDSKLEDGTISLSEIAKEYNLTNQGRMPMLGHLLVSRNFKKLAPFLATAFLLASVYFGYVSLYVPLTLSILLLPLVASKLVSWVRAFRRRNRVELFFSIIALYLYS
ncbi:hypothetical protein AAEU28_07235 [Pseudoalteromonas sp. SS15]|uniref:hypothetical protein n=1 Tax=Pseudoalteromonas sp. SS15 TaxID=3139393 RepID=UPI003BAAD75C